MLVLSRKEEETIRIGDDISVVVGRISGSRVSLCIYAPTHVPINRGEVWQRIQREQTLQSETERRIEANHSGLEEVASPVANSD